MILRAILVIALAAVPFPLLAQEEKSKTCDIETVLWPEVDHCNLDDDCLLRTVVNDGDSALGKLQKALDDKSGNCADDRREIAVHLISLIGGLKAVDTLRFEYERNPQPYTEAALCFAMGSTGRKEDIDFLFKSLIAPDPDYDRGTAVEAAAVSLGILRYKEAIPIMQELLLEEPSGLLATALERSIDWLENAPLTGASAAKPLDDSEQIAQAIISCCPLWGDRNEDRYKDHFISGDRKRALVEVMLHNKKYIYVLRNNEGWEVTGMSLVAIYD